MERQLVFGDSLEIKLEVQLDRIDQAILSIFSSHPTRSYKYGWYGRNGSRDQEKEDIKNGISEYGNGMNR